MTTKDEKKPTTKNVIDQISFLTKNLPFTNLMTLINLASYLLNQNFHV